MQAAVAAFVARRFEPDDVLAGMAVLAMGGRGWAHAVRGPRPVSVWAKVNNFAESVLSKNASMAGSSAAAARSSAWAVKRMILARGATSLNRGAASMTGQSPCQSLVEHDEPGASCSRHFKGFLGAGRHLSNGEAGIHREDSFDKKLNVGVVLDDNQDLHRSHRRSP